MADLLARHQWAHRPPSRRPAPIAVRQPRVWLHHGAGGASLISTARSYLDYHLGRGWADVGYSWLIAEGRVLEGRGPGRAGSHTRGDNSASYGICMVGDYERRLPADRDIEALVWLLQHGVGRGWWSHPEITGGHRDAPGARTACPGTALWRHIGRINDLAEAEEDEMNAEQDQRLKRVEQQLSGLGAAVAELSHIAADLSRSVGGRMVGNDLQRLRTSVRAIAADMDLPTEHPPVDGPVQA